DEAAQLWEIIVGTGLEGGRSEENRDPYRPGQPGWVNEEPGLPEVHPRGRGHRRTAPAQIAISTTACWLLSRHAGRRRTADGEAPPLPGRTLTAPPAPRPVCPLFEFQENWAVVGGV